MHLNICTKSSIKFATTTTTFKKQNLFHLTIIILTILTNCCSSAENNNKNNSTFAYSANTTMKNLNYTTEPLNIHVIPHSHDDPGWLRTFSEYYDGSRNMGCVKCILNTMLQSLQENENRTFTYVEISFFEKWYQNLSEANKLKIKFFVEQGRLEFSNGGWVMNDEATTHYQHIIDQMRLGMIFLKKEFDVVPKTAWFLDPFGHSASNAHLMRKLGFENMVIVRIDFRDKQKRKENKELEFIWNPYASVSKRSENYEGKNLKENGRKSEKGIFTHVTWGHYSPDGEAFKGFFDRVTLDAWMIKSQMSQIYKHFCEVAKAYRTNEIMFLYGDDFVFSDKAAFENIEKLMRFFREAPQYKEKIKLFYSTPSRYFQALKEKISAKNVKIPEYADQDFFPYADKPREYWTGYFTSRPYLKGLVRDAGNYLKQTSQFLFGFVLRSNFEMFIAKDGGDNLQLQRGEEQERDKKIFNLAPKHSLEEDCFNNGNLRSDKFNFENNINNYSNNNNDINQNNDAVTKHYIKGEGKNNKENSNTLKINNSQNGNSNYNNNLKNNNKHSTNKNKNIPFLDNQGNNMLQNFIKQLDEMRRELAIAQHHDSVTGTARDDVSNDYIKRLENGIASQSEIIKSILIKENPLSKHANPENLIVCLDSVAYEVCVDKVFKQEEILKGVLITTLNPGFTGKYVKKIKAGFDFQSELLKDSSKKIVLKKFKAKLGNSKEQMSFGENFAGNLYEELEYDLFYDEKSECYFIYYVLEFSDDLHYYNVLLQFEEAKEESQKLQNKLIKQERIDNYSYSANIRTYKLFTENESENSLEFYILQNKINFIQKIKKIKNNNEKEKNKDSNEANNSSQNNNNNTSNNNNNEFIEYHFSLTHAYYNYIPSSRNRHGAYLMSTYSERPDSYFLNLESSSLSHGKLLTQITLRYDFSSLKILIYNPSIFPEKSLTYEIESTLHKLEPKKSQKEFLLWLSSNIKNLSNSNSLNNKYRGKPEFYTDSNAMRVLKRVANTRETFELDAEEEKAAGNFFPVNSVLFIEDTEKDEKNAKQKKSLFLFNDRSQGATSLMQGEILIDVNRWSDRDDNRGLADGLNEAQSSKRDFSVGHLLALSREFDYDCLRNFVEKKPLSVFYFDYFGVEEAKEITQRKDDKGGFKKDGFDNDDGWKSKNGEDNKKNDNQDGKSGKNKNRNLNYKNNFGDDNNSEDKISSNLGDQKSNVLFNNINNRVKEETTRNLNNGYDKNSFKNKMTFTIDDLFEIRNKNCFEINYYFMSEKKILVQFYNKSDPYLFTYSNCSIKLLNIPHINFSRYNLNGVEKKNKKFFGKNFFKKRIFVSLDNLSEDSLFHEIDVPRQDFETFLVEL